MAEEGVKISQLTDLPQPTGEEYIPVEVGGQNKKVKLGNIKPDALVKTEQALTEEEQKQVQTNIGVKNTVDLVGAGTPVKVTEVWQKDKYRTPYNTIINGEGFNIYKAFKVNRGDVVIGSLRGSANVAVLSKVTAENKFITILVDGINLPSTEPQYIYYVANFNGYVEVCGFAAKTNIYVIPCKLASALTPLGGPNRKLYEAAGAKFNEETGFYELNGLTDITEEEMADIYSAGRVSTLKEAYTETYINAINKIRTNLPPSNIFWTAIGNIEKAFSINDTIEIIYIGGQGNYPLTVTSVESAFNQCSKLIKIISGNSVAIFDFNNIANTNNFCGSCSKLQELRIKNLRVGISFKGSPLLSKESLQYMVENCAATGPITITLHADVYAKVASAEAEWGDIFTLSQSKNISFVQA